MIAIATHYFAWWVLAVHAVLATRRRVASVVVACWLVASTPLLASLAEHLTTYKTQTWIERPDLDALVQLLWVLGGCGRISLLTWGLSRCSDWGTPGTPAARAAPA